MAAEYIKTYILGKLTPAKRRMIKEGKWAGAKVPVGFMVDIRKTLPDGSVNPNWRKFVPFEPYAEIVRLHFKIFLDCGGNVRKTMRRIRKERISFPETKPPKGFKVSYQLKKRGDGYYLNRNSFILMLTNPVYAGHWCYKNTVIIWNNHEAVIPVETFMQVFNLLSKYTLTGDENPNYHPAYQYVRPDLDQSRTEERPLCVGLIQSEINGKCVRAGVRYEKRPKTYIYVLSANEDVGTKMVWARRANWIDEAVVSRFRQKLTNTYKAKIWANTVEDYDQIIERDTKLKLSQLTALKEAMKNLIAGVEVATNAQFVKDIENRYGEMEKERDRLLADLEILEEQKYQQVSLEKTYALFEQAAASWDEMTADEQRNILALFIDRIEATNYSRAGNMCLNVYWRDGSTDQIQLWHKSHSNLWSVESVQKLLNLFDNGASQLDIAATFPDHKWYQIFNEIKKHRGLVRFTPSWLGKDETYEDYLASGGRKGKASGSYWRDEELTTLREMVLRQATQLEIMQEFPYRRWIRIKERIKKMFGKGTRVPLSGISQRLSYIEYAQDQRTLNNDLSSETEGRCF